MNEASRAPECRAWLLALAARELLDLELPVLKLPAMQETRQQQQPAVVPSALPVPAR